MQGREYVLFLLKNYHRLKSEVKFMEMEHQDRENGIPQLTGVFGMIISQSASRFRQMDQDMLKKTAKIVGGELRDLDDALDALPRIEKGMMKDIYINGVSWISVSHKWHISESTISRYRKKSLDKIWRYMSRGLSLTCEGVIECVRQRKETTEKNSTHL